MFLTFITFVTENNKIQNLKGLLANSVEWWYFCAVSKVILSYEGQRRHSRVEKNMLTIYVVDLVEFAAKFITQHKFEDPASTI